MSFRATIIDKRNHSVMCFKDLVCGDTFESDICSTLCMKISILNSEINAVALNSGLTYWFDDDTPVHPCKIIITITEGDNKE